MVQRSAHEIGIERFSSSYAIIFEIVAVLPRDDDGAFQAYGVPEDAGCNDQLESAGAIGWFSCSVPSNGLAKTPPMGWNSWNLFAGKVDDPTVRTIADAMVTSGMRDAGYVYVNIDDTWEGVRDSSGVLQPNEWSSMVGDAEKQMPTAPYAGPGHWNDPDMLEIGNGHMSEDEYRTHMSLWSLLASPLLAGNDVRSMSASTKSILLNKEVIAIDQDALGKQATRVAKDGDMETWVKPLADGGVAIGLFNHGSAPVQGKIVLSALHLGSGNPKTRDLWGHKDVAFSNGAYSATVPTHGVLMVRLDK